MRCLLAIAAVFLSTVLFAEEKPLVVFVGDSITAGRPSGRADYTPTEAAVPAGLTAGNYGYVEALVEATLSTDVPYRFHKLGSGGQAITGWIGTCCRQILEKRHRSVKEMPAILIVQDYIVTKDEESRQKLREALTNMAGYAKKAGNVRLVWSTVVVEPGGNWSGKTRPEDIKATNDIILEKGKELSIPVIRLDVAWQRYLDRFKDRKPVRDWRITLHGKIYDGVHPGRVGAYFQALVFARELGIPAERFNETAAPLAMEKGQADEIKKLVYSWNDPTAVPPPDATKKDEKKE